MPSRAPSSASLRSAWRPALTLGALVALAVWVLRVAVVVILEVRLRGADQDFILWRVGEDFVPLGSHAVLAGAAAALACRLAARGRMLALLGLLVAAAVVFSALAGWPWADTEQRPGTDSNLGRMGLAGMSLAALLLATLAVLLGRSRAKPGFLDSPAAVALSLLALVAFPYAYHSTLGRGQTSYPGKTQPVTRVLHELAFEDHLWEALEHPPRGKPRAYVITPSYDYRLDGGDMPALVMPAPSTVRFEVPDDGGEVWLTGRTGIDLVATKSLPADVPFVRIRFSVTVDGEEAWHSLHAIRAQGEGESGGAEGLLWKDLDDIPLQPGQEVVLATEIVEPAGLAQLPLIAMGFGSLVLERREEKRLLEATPESPNVVLIVMDTLRQDRLSCYGYELDTSPALDRLAERGILYENAYSTASWTWPATASILTGLHPETHGVLADGECYLNNTVETLPELLSGRNFITGAFTCNPLIVPNKNFDQGFDHFDSFHRFRHSEQVIGDVRDWIRMNADARFFLYIQFTDTHEKYKLLPEALERVGGRRPEGFPREGLDAYHGPLLRGEGHDDEGNSTVAEFLSPEFQDWMQRAYDAAVITADDFVGQVLEELAAQGLEDNTIVAFTSDHGEEILDHGMVTHGHTLYPELTRVPLILAGPGLPRGERVETPVSNRHLAPSLAAIGNAFFEVEQDAVDLKSPANVRAQPIFFSTKQGWWNGKYRVDLFGVRDGDWELHWAPKGGDWGAETVPEGGQARLYDLTRDPTALNDVADQHPELASRLLELLRNHIGRAIEGRPKLTVGAGKRSHQDLIGIGYIQIPAEDEGEERDEQASPFEEVER